MELHAERRTGLIDHASAVGLKLFALAPRGIQATSHDRGDLCLLAQLTFTYGDTALPIRAATVRTKSEEGNSLNTIFMEIGGAATLLMADAYSTLHGQQ